MKKLKNIAAKMIPSLIVVDFEKDGGNHSIQEVAPYPDGLVDTNVPINKASSGWEYVRTPDERFENLPDYPFAPNYVEKGINTSECWLGKNSSNGIKKSA